jgi:trehalose-6-phosphatase
LTSVTRIMSTQVNHHHAQDTAPGLALSASSPPTEDFDDAQAFQQLQDFEAAHVEATSAPTNASASPDIDAAKSSTCTESCTLNLAQELQTVQHAIATDQARSPKESSLEYFHVV